MKKFISLMLFLTLCLSTMLLLASCSSKENDFCDLYEEYAVDVIGKDAQITEISTYKDSFGGELAVISVKEKEASVFVTKEYYLVLSDIVFKGEEIELNAMEAQLYGQAVKNLDGKTLEKGYCNKSYGLADDYDADAFKEEYTLLSTWKLLVAEMDTKTEYDIDKINELLG